MPVFSSRSQERLDTCHKDLRIIANEVIQWFDFTVLEGHRSKERQNALYAAGKSQLRYPTSEHNHMPSRAIDVAPYPIEWGARERFIYLAGAFAGTAQALYRRGEIDHVLRWGGDWDEDTCLGDNDFDDLGHFELTDPDAERSS